MNGWYVKYGNDVVNSKIFEKPLQKNGEVFDSLSFSRLSFFYELCFD